jgi:hypothetical protein
MADIGKMRVRMVRVPFNFKWPRSSRVSVIRELGPALLDEAIGQAAIDQGAAEPFDPVKAPARRSPAKRKAAMQGNAADERQPDRVGNEGLAADDSADDQSPMDDAG